ncbi:hypothetical protein H311_04775 [Anncaliia algerae PRA109]|nr:hypothetical protein H311_04775 [Anncaliia algerae PRA109]
MSPHNQADATSVVKIENNITRAFIRGMEKQKSETLIHIIWEKVISGSIIYTDEHKGYLN